MLPTKTKIQPRIDSGGKNNILQAPPFTSSQKHTTDIFSFLHALAHESFFSKGRGKRKDKKKSESSQLLNLHRENRRTYLMIRTSSHSIKLLGFVAKSLGLILQSSFSDTKPPVTQTVKKLLLSRGLVRRSIRSQ